MKDIRRELFEITEKYVKDKFHIQISAINKLKCDNNLNIELYEEFDINEPNYNCYAFAFDLKDSIEVKQESYRLKSFLPNSEFCITLVQDYFEKCSQNNISDGDYVIYFNNGLPVHAGKYLGSQIFSKWGLGHIWLHDIFIVPSSFGNKIVYYKKIKENLINELYKDWVAVQLQNH